MLLDYLLQVTAFVALLALDTHRLEQGRYDCWPCLRCVCVGGGGRVMGGLTWGLMCGSENVLHSVS